MSSEKPPDSEPGEAASVIKPTDQQRELISRAKASTEALDVDSDLAAPILHATYYLAPLPPPKILAGYREIQSDLPERFLREWETEAAHRRALEREELALDHARLSFEREELKLEHQTQVFGVKSTLAVALAAMAAAIALGAFGLEWAATVVGGMDIAAIAAAFVTATLRKPRAEKTESPDE